jgi:hypothetical protein
MMASSAAAAKVKERRKIVAKIFMVQKIRSVFTTTKEKERKVRDEA